MIFVTLIISLKTVSRKNLLGELYSDVILPYLLQDVDLHFSHKFC